MTQFNRNTFHKQLLSAVVGSSMTSSLPQIGCCKKIGMAQPDRTMKYRSLGSTNMMILQLTIGTAFWKDETVFPLFDTLIERGVNYVDASPAYQRGASEKTLGTLLKRPGLRDRLFIANKISLYDEFLTRLTNEIFNGLPNEKKKALRKQADQLMEEKNLLRPGYHFTYFKNQAKKIEHSCLRHVINRVWPPKKLKPKLKPAC